MRDKEISPGTIDAGRLNYGLHERVVHEEVLPKVKEARQRVVESRPDILGLRGPQWTSTTYLYPHKHTLSASDQALTNTLSPKLINPTDFRTLKGTTHSPASKQADLLERSSPRRQPRSGASDWNASTIVAGPRERTQALLQDTLRSCSATRSRSPRARTSLYAQQVALQETIRAKKANEGVDVKELETQYGPEGAQAMLTILSMPKREPWPPGRPKPRGIATKDDLEAVKALPDDLGEQYESTGGNGEEGEGGEGQAGVTSY